MKKKSLVAIISSAITFVVLLSAYGQRGVSNKQRVANDSSGLYFKDKRGVYIFVPRDCGFFVCIGPDLRSEAEKYQKIPLADPNTFRILIDPQGPGRLSSETLARDHIHVFYGGEYVPTADVNSLKVFGSYAKDKNNLYYSGQIITGIDIQTVKILGMNFLSDRNGLYVANAIPPRKAVLVDYPSFQMGRPAPEVKGRDYFAQDKNFYYYSDGGTYLVDSKPNTQDFKKLGCGYYFFQGQMFYSLYQLTNADVATFRVLTGLENPDRDIDSCRQFYAIDGNHGYEFDTQVRADDTYRNHRIELLLATPEDRKKMSARSSFICVPHESPGVNFGFSRARPETASPGTIRLLQYLDAAIVEGGLMSADGQWQQLPSISDWAVITDCNSIGMQRFYDVNKKPWFARRDATSTSLIINQFQQEPLFVICDNRYSIKLAFSKTALIREFKNALRDSRVAPFDGNEPGWGSGWILEDKFFMSTEGAPEVWVPLRIKNAPTAYKEGRDFVTVGFRYQDNQFECIDGSQCSSFAVPLRFKVDLR